MVRRPTDAARRFASAARPCPTVRYGPPDASPSALHSRPAAPLSRPPAPALRRGSRLPVPAGQLVLVAGRVRPDLRAAPPARRPRPRPGVVQRAPLRRRRVPAELRAGGRRGGGG